MKAGFQFTIGVYSLTESTRFFSEGLGGKIIHQDPEGFTIINLFGVQLTLKRNKSAADQKGDFQFGFNLNEDGFNQVAQNIMEKDPEAVKESPRVLDEGTDLERLRMVVRSPTGYLIEIKGYNLD